MNAAMYPEADQTATARPTTAMTDPTPALPWSWCAASVMTSRAEPGASFRRLSRTRWVADSPAMPSSETSTSSAGNSDRTP